MKMTHAREPATVARARKYGMANQMAHESSERQERTAMLLGMKKQKKADMERGRMNPAVRKPMQKRKEKGVNAGTYGGSRASLARAFFGARA